MNLTKILFFAGLVLCLPLYGFLCMTNLDAVTGFFSESSLPVVLFYAAVFLIPVLMILFSIALQKKLSFSISNSKVLSVLSFCIGGVMLLGSVLHTVELVAVIRQILAMSEISMLPPGMLLGTVQIPMAILSGIVFIRLGIGYLKESIANRNTFTFLFPLIWALINCIEMFQQYPQIAGMPERTLYLLCLLSFTLFLMGQTRLLNDIDFSKGIRWVSAFGLCAALFGLTMTVGEIVAFSSMTLPLFDVLFTFILSLYCIAFSSNVRAVKSAA